jgi:hypothetical protein
LLATARSAAHGEQKPFFRSDFTGAGRLPATKRTHNSKQMYSIQPLKSPSQN